MTDLYGPFERAFRKHPEHQVGAYLALLNLNEPSGWAVEVVRECCGHARSRESAVRLLGDANWRMNLVGGVALLVSEPAEEQLTALWSALGRDSWVTPQLAVIAARVDPDFVSQARRRVQGGWMTQHPSQSEPSPSGKLLGSLLAMLEQSAADAQWLAETRARADVLAALDEDRDDGSGIAHRWHRAIEPLLR
jgi:hypothetical protein